MTFQCTVCKAENQPEDSFCQQCGERLHLVCESCGNANKPSAKFCPKCGTPTASVSIKSKLSQKFQTLTSEGGERKFITVLFADIKNSTELVETADPEIALKRIGPVLTLMSEAVLQYEGVVSETLGDGILALFGTPKPLEDHPVRACLAALLMQEKVSALKDSAVQIRIGIHSGEVIVKAVDATLTNKLGAIGQVVHVANRIEQLCDAGDIVVSEVTFKQARQYVDAHSLGGQSIKGVSQPIHVYRIAGLRSAPASSIFRTQDQLQPLAGRREQLAQLNAALECATRGQAVVVGVIGEAGIGKSRLCYEFVEGCRRQDVSILEARAAPFGEATPLKPMLDLLQDYFRIRPIADAGERKEAVIKELGDMGVEEDTQAIVLELLGLRKQSTQKSNADPSIRKARLTRFICDLVRQGESARPGVVLVEDLHWLDSSSMEILDAMVDAAYGSKTMLLLNFRPGWVGDWMQRSHYRAINLDPLDSAAINDLLVQTLGDDESLSGLRADLLARSHGNPLFLEELTSAIVEEGGVEGEPGDYRATSSLNLSALPLTIQGLLSTRIDSLEPTPKKLLQIAAIIGREIPVDVLSEVAHLSKEEFEQGLRTLRRLELLYEMPRVQRHALLAFRHPLIQEVAYHNILSEKKSQLHAAVVEALFNHFKDRLDEGSAVLAYHFEKAGDALNAAQAYARSATWLGANDPRQALATWKRVDQLLKSQSSRPDIDMLRTMACGQVVNFGWREGISAEEARSFFQEASRLAVAGKNFRGNALIHAAYGRILAAGGSADEYVDKVKEAQSIAGGTNDASLRLTLGAVLSHALRLSGRLGEALEVNEEALSRTNDMGKFEREMLGFDVEPWLMAMRGQTLVALGRGDEARPFLDMVIALDSTQVDLTHHVVPSLAYVEWAWATQDIKLAQEHSERAMQMAAKSGSPYLMVYALWAGGLSSMISGKANESIDLFLKALKVARERKSGMENEPRLLADLANSYRLAGDLHRAIEIAQEAIAVAQARRQRVPELYSHHVRGSAFQEAGEYNMANQEREKADDLLVNTGAAVFLMRFAEQDTAMRV